MITGSKYALAQQCTYWARPEVQATLPPHLPTPAMIAGTATHAAIDAFLKSMTIDPQWSESIRRQVEKFSAYIDTIDGLFISEVAYATDGLVFERIYPVGHRDYGRDHRSACCTIDALVSLGDTLHVFDWKTGAFCDAHEHQPQLIFGATMAWHAMGSKHTRVVTHVVHIPVIGDLRDYVTEVDLQTIRDTGDEIYELLQALPTAPPSPGVHCDRCPAVAICPAVAKITAETAIYDRPITTDDHAREAHARIAIVRAKADAMESDLRSYIDRIGGLPMPSGKKLVRTETARESIEYSPAVGEMLSQHLGIFADDAMTVTVSKSSIARALENFPGPKQKILANQIAENLKSLNAIRVSTTTTYREK